MPVQYNVDSNLLTDPPTHYPRVAPVLTLDQMQIAELINLHNPNIPVKTADMCIGLFIEEVKNQLAEGNWVKLDNFCSFSTSIVGGSLENPADPLPGTAKVELRFKPSAPFKLSVQELASIERIGYTSKSPDVIGVRDVDLGVSKVARDGMPLELVGSNIGFNPSASDEGIFIIVDGGAEAKQSVVARNKPSNVIVVPSVSASSDGETAAIVYSRSRYTTNGQLKQGAFQYIRIPNTIASGAIDKPIFKPYGAINAVNCTAPVGPIDVLMTMKINTQNEVICYGQEIVDGVLGAAGDEVVIAEGLNTVTVGGKNFSVSTGSLTNLFNIIEAEGRFVQEIIAVAAP